jgi:hypothetical protein
MIIIVKGIIKCFKLLPPPILPSRAQPPSFTTSLMQPGVSHPPFITRIALLLGLPPDPLVSYPEHCQGQTQKINASKSHHFDPTRTGHPPWTVKESNIPLLNKFHQNAALPFSGAIDTPRLGKTVAPPSCTSDRYPMNVAILSPRPTLSAILSSGRSGLAWNEKGSGCALYTPPMP